MYTALPEPLYPVLIQQIINYEIIFPFFEPNGESYLNLLGRDSVVEAINEIILPYPENRRKMKRQKYWPVIISTSRGMGKTFLLKMIGLQKVKPELENILIKEAGFCGRIFSFDFAKKFWSYSIFRRYHDFFPR